MRVEYNGRTPLQLLKDGIIKIEKTTPTAVLKPIPERVKVEPAKKTCKCGAIKGEVPFRNNRNTCIDCWNEYQREYRAKNKGKFKEYGRRYLAKYYSNPENVLKERERCRVYRAKKKVEALA